MKNNLVYLLTLLLVVTFTSCDETPVVFDNVNGQVALQFTTRSFNVSVPDAGLSVVVPVSVTTVSTAARTFTVALGVGSTAPIGSYSLGTVTIPAGSYSGTLDVSLKNTSLADGISYTLPIKLIAPEGGVVFNETATIKFNKVVICNALVLTVTTDRYAEETSWKITNSAGAVVASIVPGTYGPANSVVSRGKVYKHNINLPNGTYTLIMEDTEGDGLFDGTYNGSYSLDCSIINHASGTGNYGRTKSTSFKVN